MLTHLLRIECPKLGFHRTLRNPWFLHSGFERCSIENTKVTKSLDADARSDEDEDGDPKPKLGSGLWGHGPPLTSMLMGKQRAFSDGFGLCSRRWMPCMRRSASDTPSLGFLGSVGHRTGKEAPNLLRREVASNEAWGWQSQRLPFP